jgi:two-component system cell cycle sensor histidine kinase/response regulator CckA
MPLLFPERVAPARGVTVLIVDDEPLIRDVAGHLLHRAGFRVLTADGGLSAIAMLDPSLEPVHVVMLDLSMPDMDGAETCRAIKSARPDIPVLLTSGYPEDFCGLERGPEGYDGFLDKPFGPDELTAAIEALTSDS